MSELTGLYKQEIPYGDIHRQFVQSEYAEGFSANVRFERFKPAYISNEEWVGLLGHDVDPIEHMPITYGLTRAFLNHYHDTEAQSEANAFTDDEEEVLLLAAITNNWGEAIVGNTSYDLKTVDLEKNEKDAHRIIFGELCSDIIDVKIRMLVERTIFDKHTKLGQVFDAIQKVGYLRTALFAHQQGSEVSDTDSTVSGHLAWLCANVLSNQIMMLIEYGEHYEPIKNYLLNQHYLISEAFNSISPGIFTFYGQNESIRGELFRQNQRSWQEFNKFEITDLKNEINKLVGLAISEEKSFDEVERELDNLLNLYAKTIASKSLATTASREFFDGGLFGSLSNFEARFISDFAELERKVAAIRELGLKIVLTSGSFDLLHVGHAAYLEKAKQYGDVLIVGVDSDEKMKRKGPDRPHIPETERTRLLAHQRGVDIITVKPAEEEKWALIKLVCPDTLITTQETYTEKELTQLHEHCGRVVVLPPQATTSTSAKIRRMNMGFGQKFLESARQSLEQIDLTQADAAQLRQHINETLEAVLEEVLQNA